MNGAPSAPADSTRKAAPANTKRTTATGAGRARAGEVVGRTGAAAERPPAVYDDTPVGRASRRDVSDRNPLVSFASSGWRAVTQGGSVRSAGRLTREAVRIARGSSDLAPARQDGRFRDPTWNENPAYRRLMQLYLAWSSEVEGLVDGAELEWRDAERARFLAAVFTSSLSPTNALLGNPAALKRALETGGGSLLHGARNFLRDLRDNGGMPATVDRRPFNLGENLAATPGAVVARDEVCEVIQYAPTTPHVSERPTLMIAPQINKYYFMDLAPQRSFIEHAVASGIPFFAVSWRNPSAAQHGWDLDTYAAAVLRAIDVVRDITRSDDVNLLSLCAGGILTATVLNYLAARSDERVNSASFGVTLLDFDVPAPIGTFDARTVLPITRLRARRSGVLDGRALSTVFTWLRPNDLVWKYWVNNYLLGNDPPSFDILAWNADTTNLPAALHGQFLDIFTNNAIADAGAMTVLDTPVDLRRVTTETYVTGATTDHLTPWRGCYRTTQLMRGDSTFVLSNAGHIASLINPPGNPKAHFFAGPEPVADPEQWLRGAERRPGTWWEHWTGWIAERSGEERKAPSRLGNRAHKVIEPAPGSYVRGLAPSLA